MSLVKNIQIFVASKVSAHPYTFILCVAFLAFWLGAYFGTNGRFDPGLGLGNIIINAVGMILTLSCCALADKAADKAMDAAQIMEHNEAHHQLSHGFHETTHSMLSEIHELVSHLRRKFPEEVSHGPIDPAA